MTTTELLRVGRESALAPVSRNAGGAFFGGCIGVHIPNLDPLQRAVLIPLTTTATAHPQSDVRPALGEAMNDIRPEINPRRELSRHFPADMAKALQQAVHEWPRRQMLSRINQLEIEAVARGLRRLDPMMGARLA